MMKSHLLKRILNNATCIKRTSLILFAVTIFAVFLLTTPVLVRLCGDNPVLMGLGIVALLSIFCVAMFAVLFAVTDQYKESNNDDDHR